MSIEQQFRDALLAHAPLTALIGARVAQHSVPQGDALPLVVYRVLRTPVLGIDNTAFGDDVSIQVQAWAASAAVARQVADAVRAACQASGKCCVVAEASVTEEDLMLDGVELTVDWWGS